jgi:hypothetical protein
MEKKGALGRRLTSEQKPRYRPCRRTSSKNKCTTGMGMMYPCESPLGMFWKATPTTLGGRRCSLVPLAPPPPSLFLPPSSPSSSTSSSSSSAPAAPSSRQGPPDAPPLIGESTWMAMKLLALCTYCVTSTRLITPDVTHALSPPAG